MKIREDFTIGHPVDAVWSFLTDPDLAADCIPGLSARDGLVLQVGDDSLRLVGSARSQLLKNEQALVVDLRGTDPSEEGRARARLVVTVEDGGLFSTVHVDADVTLTGALGELGRSGRVAEIANAMVDEFAGCVERRLGTGRSGGSSAADPHSEVEVSTDDSDPLDADGDAGWLRRIFRRVSGHG